MAHKKNWWFRFLESYGKHAFFVEASLTVIAIILAWCLWKETQKQVRVAMDSLKSQETLSQESMRISQQIANTQEKYSKIDTRAYMVFQKVTDWNFQVGEPLTAKLVFINSGKTPAEKIQCFGMTKIGTGVYSHEIDSLESLEDQINYSPCGPGISFNHQLKFRSIKKQDSIDVMSGHKSIYFFGRMTYCDIFGEYDTLVYCQKYFPPNSYGPVTTYNRATSKHF